MRNNPARGSEALVQLQKGAELAPYDPWAQYSYRSAQLSGKGGKDEADKRAQLLKEFPDIAVPMRIRIGGQVMQAKSTSRPSPRYPAEARAAHIQGTVHLEILVGRDGAVKDLEVISGESLLAPAALEAVAKWRYQPTLLNHEPVEVITAVYINFTLSR